MDRDIPCIDQGFLGGRGAFYVGGSYVDAGKGHYLANQMFVEYYKPKEVRRPYPVIMFHGAGQTNMNWLITPDGRMGWADYFVSEGYRVFLAEQPARGRSAYHPGVHGAATFHPAEVIEDRFTSDCGAWSQAGKHTQWVGNGKDWNDPVFRQFAAAQVEYLADNKKTQELVLEAGRELLETTGPAVLLTHSQGGPFGWLMADRFPGLVKGIVAVEPFGPPFSNDPSVPEAKNYGLAELPLGYGPPVDEARELELEWLEGDGKGRKGGWILKEPAPQLPNLKGIPILILTGEASYHAGYDHLTSRVLSQCGVEHDFVRLEDVGIHGNGHMMMLERNSLEIAEWICRWLERR